MRPLQKWVHTDVAIVPPIHETYNPYANAKDDLERNIDGYCCYCERPATDEAGAVEHIQPKGLAQYAALEFSWSNFLIACDRCNGKDNKSDKDVVFANIHLPHLNNTVISISYKEGGLVQVNNTLTNQELSNATALINLVGLDKRPGHPQHLPKDKRWDRRREVWEIAKRNLTKYEVNSIDSDTVLDLARGYGFWSVWYNVFINHNDVKQVLINGFRGTAACFDINCNPIHRNPGSLDTV